MRSLSYRGSDERTYKIRKFFAAVFVQEVFFTASVAMAANLIKQS